MGALKNQYAPPPFSFPEGLVQWEGIKQVFVTGGTGILGRGLIYQLLSAF